MATQKSLNTYFCEVTLPTSENVMNICWNLNDIPTCRKFKGEACCRRKVQQHDIAD